VELSASGWSIDAVIPVGDRFLYWIDLSRGIVFSDVTAASPELRYVPLPADPLLSFSDEYDPTRMRCPAISQSVCVTGGGSAVKFVRVSPRPRSIFTACLHSRLAFSVTTWTLRLRTDGMSWEDGVLDSDELWAAGVPRSVARIRQKSTYQGFDTSGYGIPPDTSRYISRTYPVIFYFPKKENKSDTSGIQPRYGIALMT
jgi:hypothetical protein